MTRAPTTASGRRRKSLACGPWSGGGVGANPTDGLPAQGSAATASAEFSIMDHVTPRSQRFLLGALERVDIPQQIPAPNLFQTVRRVVLLEDDDVRQRRTLIVEQQEERARVGHVVHGLSVG